MKMLSKGLSQPSVGHKPPTRLDGDPMHGVGGMRRQAVIDRCVNGVGCRLLKAGYSGYLPSEFPRYTLGVAKKMDEWRFRHRASKLANLSFEGQNNNSGWESMTVLSSPWDREILGLAIPALLTTLLDPIMGMIDTAIVGRLGTEPLAACGLATIVYNFSNFIWNFLVYTTTPRIAAAASNDDLDSISHIATQGLWVALAIGLFNMVLLFTTCPIIFAKMGAGPDVLHYAVPYLRARCFASPAIMMSYVLSGTFRGFKDTRTTLHASIWSNILHIILDIVFVFWIGLGPVGAALATTVSLWLNFGILIFRIFESGFVKPHDLATLPTWSDVSPMLKNGALLSTRSVLGLTTILAATKLCTGLGAVALGAHEILRQIWVVSNQAFTSLDIATQSLVAFYLGTSDKRSAASVFHRTMTLGSIAGVIITASLFFWRNTLPAIFTKDMAVIDAAASVMPLIALFMPLDGAASVMDGVLLGSQQAGWMSKTMVVTSLCCGLALIYCHQSPGTNILCIWAAIKILTVGRLIGNAWRVFWSRKSPLGERWWTSTYP